MTDREGVSSRGWIVCLVLLAVAYAHHTLPYLTMMPRVNVDEPWLIERAYQVLHTGLPRQPMLGLTHAYLLQPGYGYLVAPWIGLFGVGIFQARLLAAILGLVAVLAIAGVGRRLAGRAAGLFAAAFLLSDSNFLGAARMARTDIPAVCFVALALLLFLVGRDTRRPRWYAASGVSTAAAILCHGNSFWVAVILGIWYAIDQRRHVLVRPYGYAYAAGLLAGLAPYLLVVVLNRHELSVQIASFAGDRVPGWRPSFLLQQIRLEPERYRDWYFGLITDTVRNPLLRAFQIAIVAGVVQVLAVAVAGRPSGDERRRAVFLLVLALGAAAIFACFINNKALVYMPHLLLGFSLLAGSFMAWASGIVSMLLAKIWSGRRIGAGAVAITLVASHAAAGVVYYQKWYALTRRTELLPYESTARTIDNMLPAGPKYVFAAPQFWMPFAEQTGVEFFSHAAPGPVGSPGHMWPPWVRDSRPLFLLLDERQFEPELIGPANDPRWQRPWIAFITGQCRLRSYAPGSAYGTLAAYECQREGVPPERPVFLASDEGTYQAGETFIADGPEQITQWRPNVDPRTDAGASHLDLTGAGGVRVTGTRWPGIERSLTLTPGQPYLLTADVTTTSTEDLLYIGRWSPPEVVSLSHGSSAGIVEPAARPSWFPGGHAFIATAATVRVLFYSEKPDADFTVRRVQVATLRPLNK